MPKPLRATHAICESGPSMPETATDYRISHIALDEETILWRNADVEQERRVAIFDLIEENTFKPVRSVQRGNHGPYRLQLAVRDGRLAMDIADEAGEPLESLLIGLARFRRPIREYFAICDSYYQAIRKATAAEIETIDMARRGVVCCVHHDGTGEGIGIRLVQTAEAHGGAVAPLVPFPGDVSPAAGRPAVVQVGVTVQPAIVLGI